MKKFWNWVKNEGEGRTLRLQGPIAEESWYGDEVTPALFRDELNAEQGAVTLWINSPGGDCIAAAQIYNMLMDYKGDVTINIDGIAASAASVIAMAGGIVNMSPTSLLMIHNPFTLAMGDKDELKSVIQMLDEVKESIINAYVLKTGLNRLKLSNLMDAETWLNANKALELGFADNILFAEKAKPTEDSFTYGCKTATVALYNKLKPRQPEVPIKGTPVIFLEKRLKLLKY